MLLPRPVHTLVAGALGATLVLSGASAASAAPAKGPVKGRSVPALRSTAYSSGVSSARHCSSVFVTS